jgi:GNAT superfamily N-acetyltransferase
MLMNIRPARLADLESINRVISAAVMTWDLPERVKRLALSSYHYHAVDFAHFGMCVAEQHDQIVGVAAWEPADPRDLPDELAVGAHGLLLHGLYVDPSHQRQGLGRLLLQPVLQAAQQASVAGVLVKAQSDAVPFFRALGWTELAVRDRVRDYPHRYWQAL